MKKDSILQSADSMHSCAVPVEQYSCNALRPDFSDPELPACSDPVQTALAFYQSAKDSDQIPESYRQLFRWYLSQPVHDPYEEALDLMHIDEDQIMPAPVFSYLSQFFCQQAPFRPQAWNDLGVLCYSGRSGVCDLKSAFECYKKGDRSGDLNSSQNLGFLYRFGQGVPVNLMAAWYYFSKGALAGMPASMLQLARMMEAGDPFPKDLHMAFRLYERLYEESDPDEECSLWSSVCLGMARILEQIGDELQYWLDPQRLYRFALSNARDVIDASNDPVLYKELLQASRRLEELEKEPESRLHAGKEYD